MNGLPKLPWKPPTVTNLDRRTRVLRAVKLYANGARTDVVVAAFQSLGIDVCGNTDHLRAVAQLAVCVRLHEPPTEGALALLGCEVAA